MSEYPRDPSTDKQGRVVDPFNGRPLRDHRHRNYGTAAYMGQPAGKAHPRAKALAARIARFEADRSKHAGRKKPGSYSK